MVLEDDEPDYWSKRVDYLDTVQDKLQRLRERFHQDEEEERERVREEERERVCEEEEGSRVNYGHEELVGSDLEDNGFEGSEYEDSESDEDNEVDNNEDEVLRIEARVDDGEGSDYEHDNDLEVDNEPLKECRGRGNGHESWKKIFILGASYSNKSKLIEDVDNYAIGAGVDLWLKNNETSRVRVECQVGCPFVLHASKDGKNGGLVVKTLQLEHSCSRAYDSRRATAKWLAIFFKKRVQDRLQYKCKDMKADVAELFKLHVSIYKCKWAKRIIMQEMEGSYIDEFNKLEAYCHELRTRNPRSDISVEIRKDVWDTH